MLSTAEESASRGWDIAIRRQVVWRENFQVVGFYLPFQCAPAQAELEGEVS